MARRQEAFSNATVLREQLHQAAALTAALLREPETRRRISTMEAGHAPWLST